MQTMRALQLSETMLLRSNAEPLRLVDLPVPEPADQEIRIKIAACGVCHTELDEIEGRLATTILPVVPGHEVIGYVDKLGRGVNRWHCGERVGVGWIHCSSGGALENLSDKFLATGCDVNGGYAEFMLVHQDYAHAIPACFSDTQAAPLLCAGAVGYRALSLCQLRDGQTLGFTGFGGSAHLVLQLARHLYPRSSCYVFARDEQARKQAVSLGADWAGAPTERAPQLLNVIIDTTPAWQPVLQALENLAPAGRLVINAIRKEEQDKHCLSTVDYAEHLWREKEIKTVANVTAADIGQFLPLAAAAGIVPEVQIYPFMAANQALCDLKHRPVRGAKVLTMA